VRTHVQVEVPSRRPLDVGVLPLSVVGEEHLDRFALPLDRLRGQVGADGNGQKLDLREVIV
jgi:hypothetical protein